MNSKIVIRLSKSGQTLDKSKSYQIKINGNVVGQINNQHAKLTEELPAGKYSIEVEEKGFLRKMDVVLAFGEMQTITINPSLSFYLIRGFLIGVAIAAVCVIGFIMYEYKKFPQMTPLLFIPLIPLLVFSKKEYGERFALTSKKNRLL
jgi:hypothetical protein